MNISLTKHAKKSLAKIYKEYERRRREGQTKAQAKYFDSYIPEQVDFINSVWKDIPELKKAGLVKAYVTACFELQNSAIIYMENLTVNTIKEWLSFGSNFLP